VLASTRRLIAGPAERDARDSPAVSTPAIRTQHRSEAWGSGSAGLRIALGVAAKRRPSARLAKGVPPAAPARPGRSAVGRVALPPKRDSDPLCRASKNGREQFIAGGGEYRLGLRADAIDTVRAVLKSRSSRCEHQLACPVLGQVSVFRVIRAEKRGWKGATFQGFAAIRLRKAGYVSTSRGDVAAEFCCIHGAPFRAVRPRGAV